MTKRNPRPRKYASQAERQAAYRARNVMLEFRAEPKTADNITKISDTLGYPRSDVLLSMVKFALTNHDWARFGLTHKTIPTYKENPTMKPASPAQIAARKRFAEMARSGAFKKKATKRKANPLPPVVETILEQMGGNKFMVMTGARPVVHGPHMLTFKLPTNQSKANYLDVIHNPGKDLYTMTFRRVSNRGMDSKNLVEYDDVYADQLQPMFEKVTGMYTTLGTMGRKTNPTSGSNAGEFAMTVNGKTVHRFFVHTSDPWAKSHGFDYQLVSNVTKNGAFVKFTKTRAIVAVDEAADGSAVTEKWEIRNLVFYKTNPAKKTVSQKISQLVHEGYPQRQAVAVALSEQRAGKIKRNPMHQYTVFYRGTRNVAGQVTASGPQAARQKVAEKLGIPTLTYLVARKTNPAKVKYRNLATDLKGDQRVGYSVHLASQPGHNAIAWFSKKADALAVAQEAADRTGKPLAVTRVQNYFGAM